jgi:CBS-domain-containing membrane protein
MLVQQIIQKNFPALTLADKVSFALQLMDDYDVNHLPVTQDEKYVGMVSKEDLLDADETNTIATLEELLIKTFVTENDFFLTALKQLYKHEITIVAVINNQQEIIGVITQNDLIQQIAIFNSIEERGGIIVIETEKRHFSFGEISRLVETNDAYITQLNTYTEAETGLTIVCFKINKSEISDVVATLQRYDYTVRHYFGEEQYNNEMKDNFNQLMLYLNM